jgi:membrane-bound lytic murein transglycosylase B
MVTRRLLLGGSAASIAAPALAQDGFDSFLEGVRAEARRSGISPATVQRALSGLRPNPRVIELYERGITIEPTLGELGKNRDVGELATRGPAEKAVLKMLTHHA